MPRSKRAQVVHLSKVKKKTKENKERHVSQIREWLTKFRHCYVLRLENTQTAPLQALRELLKPGRLFCGKNTIMQIAIGVDPSSSAQDDIFKLSAVISETSALLFSDDNQSKVEEALATLEGPAYALPGAPATETIVLEAGAETLAHFPHSIEPTLRQLGLPTRLMDSKLILLGDYTVCEEGKPIGVNAAKLLRHLNKHMAVMRAQIVGSYDAKAAKVRI